MAGQAGGEIRRVQRLGSSSLVVTLPKSWVKSMNLKPGDPVMVVVEGRGLRIYPVEGSGGGGGGASRISGLTAGEARRFLWCSYVIGPDEIVVDGIGDDVYESLREASLVLVGVDISREGDRARVSILVDPAKLDPKSTIRGIAGDLERVVRLLAEAIRGKGENGAVERMRVSMQRSLALVERGLVAALTTQPSSQRSRHYVNMMIAANFLGLAASSLLDAANTAIELNVKSERLASTIEPLSKLALEAGLNVASPSLKRSRELLDTIQDLKDRLSKEIVDISMSKEEAVVLAMVLEALKHLYVASTLCYCTARILQHH